MDLSLTEHTVVSGLDMYLNQAPFARMDSGSKILMGSVSYNFIIASPFFQMILIVEFSSSCTISFLLSFEIGSTQVYCKKVLRLTIYVWYLNLLTTHVWLSHL